MGSAPRLALVSVLALSGAPGCRDRDDEAVAAVDAFEARTGARLVFEEAELPDGAWFEIKRELPVAQRSEAARIALDEAKKYPPGYFRAVGIEAIGVFSGLASHDDDGHHEWDDQLGGYRYFGQWNRRDAVIAAFYSDEQLPLTLHHEIFHQVDATVEGVSDPAALTEDDARFLASISGVMPRPAPVLDVADLAALERAGKGSILDDAVSSYSRKAPWEDQAETARYLWSHLADALVQVAEHPELPGSQRLLHVIGEYSGSAAAAPDLTWMIDVALGRDRAAGRALHQLSAEVATFEADVTGRIAPGGHFVVRGAEDGEGVNRTLRGDLARFGTLARAVRRAASGIAGSASVATIALTRNLRLLAAYHQHIAARWKITAGTERSFGRARNVLIAAIAIANAPLAGRLRARPYADLVDTLDDRGGFTELVPPPAFDNAYLENVDAAISERSVRAAIRRVQPATVRLGGGSGVNLDPRGVFLTAAHVVWARGVEMTVRFPDGTEVRAVTVVFDLVHDLAVLVPVDASDGGVLPWAPIAASAPTVGTAVVVIGHPGAWTPDGEPTGYQPWNVSAGVIRAFGGGALDNQGLGGTAHDAWTYWGHSGSPLFDQRGRIVALHNSWDPSTGMRHAVRYESIRHVLDEASAAYHVSE